MPPMPMPKMPTPLTAEAVVKSLDSLYRRIVFDLRAKGKTADWMPAWYVHLPSGEKVRIKLITKDGSLIRFTAPDEETYIVVAPTAVVITIEPTSEDSEGFPVEFLEDDEAEDTASE
jgi:hypothetical protein